MKPKYSIVIPTFNHLDDCLKPLIESIYQYTELGEAEVIIVANGCTDGTEDYVWGLNDANIRLIRYDKALGYPRAVNVGIQNARGDYIVLLNSDCVLQQQNKQDWLSLLCRPLEENPQMAITGVTEIYDKHSGYDFIIFFCAMVPKRIFAEIGLLEESFDMGGGEDIEFAIRAQRAGYKIQQVPIKTNELWTYHTWFPIYHAAEATVRHIPNWEMSFQGNMVKLRERYREPVRRSIVIAATESLEKLKECVKSIWKNTSYRDSEVIIVSDQTNEAMQTYLRELTNFGPYRLAPTLRQLPQGDAMTRGILEAKGERVFCLSGAAVLLQQDKDTWWQIMDANLVNVDLTAPVLDEATGRMWGFCFGGQTASLRGVQVCDHMPQLLTALKKKSQQSVGVPVYFGG